MEVQATLRHLRISPRKVRLVTELLGGLGVAAALHQLKAINKKATLPVSKLLKSAMANAEHNNHLAKDNLYVKNIRVDDGPSLKRWRPRAFGRASGMLKRTSHITLTLAEIKPSAEARQHKPAKDAQDKKDKDVKIVKSLDEVKETKSSDESLPAKSAEPKSQSTKPTDPVDLARQGKDREKQHLDKVRSKEKGGALRRMFRRKSV